LDKQLKDLMKLQWRDNVKSSELHSDGHYTRVFRPGEARVDAQESLMQKYRQGDLA
jgi:polyphosphate kinase